MYDIKLGTTKITIDNPLHFDKITGFGAKRIFDR